MISFDVLRWKNLLSTGNAWIEVKLNQHPMTLVVGKNGAGKSTIIDALTYVLFGKPFRDINLAGLINSINDSNMCVEVEFREGSQHYKVVRGMKPNIFEIWQNGIMIQQDAAKQDYQKILEKSILGFNMKSFTQIIVVGSSSFVPFMKLKPTERRNIIEDLLDINIFSIMNTVLRARAKNLNDTIVSIKSNVTGIMEKIELQKKYIQENKRNNAELITRKRSDLSNSEVQITELNSNANLVQRHISVLHKKIDDEPSIRGTIKTLESFRIKIDSNINNITKEMSFYTENDNCPKCKQIISNKDTMLHDCKTKLDEFASGLSQLETKQITIEERLNAIVDIHKKISAHQTELTRVLSSITEIQKQASRTQNELTELLTRKPISEDLLQVSKDLVTQLETLNTQRRDVIDKKAYYDMAALLLKDNGIKSKIIKQYLPIINKMVNKYLAAMDFFINFTIDEEFNESIKSRHRDTFSYENFSEGQKRRIDLSLLFTWRAVAKIKNSVNTNLLILDEILDGSLDADGMDEFMSLLNTFGNENNVYLISHRGDILADKFNHVLKFELVGNFSELS